MEAALDRAIEKFGLRSLKPEQKSTLFNLVEKKNVFCVLPTGFGKSICFYLLLALLSIVRSYKSYDLVLFSF